VTDTDAITVSLLSPDSAYAANTSLELVCRLMAQGDTVQINSSELTKPLIVIEILVGRAENALKITYGCGTGPCGASMKAYRPAGKRLEDVGRLICGVPVVA
jgi:hypothetical protein